MVPWYIATARFDPTSNPSGWASYVATTGLHHLNEVVTLDGLLCPPILQDVKPNYWPHIVNEDFMLQFFTDLEFLLAEIARVPARNVLCVYRNPEAHPHPPSEQFLEFVGYDLVDVYGSNSALTNCGGFPKAFLDSELTPQGLLPKRERAFEVQHALRREYKDERHADCHVWAVYRSNEL
jgi:hypothetical protein